MLFFLCFFVLMWGSGRTLRQTGENETGRMDRRIASSLGGELRFQGGRLGRGVEWLNDR